MLLMHDVIHIKILTAVFNLNSLLICVLGTHSPWNRASGEPDGSFNTLHQFAEVVYTVKLLQSSSLFLFPRLKCKLSARIHTQEGYTGICLQCFMEYDFCLVHEQTTVTAERGW